MCAITVFLQIPSKSIGESDMHLNYYRNLSCLYRWIGNSVLRATVCHHQALPNSDPEGQICLSLPQTHVGFFSCNFWVPAPESVLP